MHYFDRIQRVRLLRDKLCREVSAVSRNGAFGQFPVFREWENGLRESRNLYFAPVAGWLLQAPEDIVDGRRFGLDAWMPDGPRNDVCQDRLGESDLETIEAAVPAFRWCLRKAVDRGYNGAEVFALLRQFQAEPKVELLVSAGFKSLALSRAFLRLSGAMQRQAVEFCRANGDQGLGLAMECLKNGIGPIQWRLWKAYGPRLKWPDFRYVHENAVPVYEYEEYVGAALSVGKDLEDPYWRHPSDFRARRLTVERIIRNRKAAATRAKRETLRRIGERFKTAAAGLIDVWVPTTYEEFKEHAKALHQCLIDMDYPEKVIKGECVLVFMRTDCGHVATAELKPKGKSWKVGQFYGDEDKENYLVGPAEREALRKWARVNKLKLTA